MNCDKQIPSFKYIHYINISYCAIQKRSQVSSFVNNIPKKEASYDYNGVRLELSILPGFCFAAELYVGLISRDLDDAFNRDGTAREFYTCFLRTARESANGISPDHGACEGGETGRSK